MSMRIWSESELEDFIHESKRRVVDDVPDIQMRKAVAYALWGPNASWGSEFRGKIALLLSSEVRGGLALCLAVELGHAASLLVDDLVDGTPQRRGHPAFWTVFGKSDTTITSHCMVGMAFGLLAKNRMVTNYAISRFSDTLCQMTAAEFQGSGNVDSSDEYLHHVAAKTGALVSATALLATRKSFERQRHIEEWFSGLGILHQIADDSADMLQDSLESRGKRNRNISALSSRDVEKVRDWEKSFRCSSLLTLLDYLKSKPNYDLVEQLILSFAGSSSTSTLQNRHHIESVA